MQRSKSAWRKLGYRLKDNAKPIGEKVKWNCGSYYLYDRSQVIEMNMNKVEAAKKAIAAKKAKKTKQA